jgi:hypothetical protein
MNERKKEYGANKVKGLSDGIIFNRFLPLPDISSTANRGDVSTTP